MGGQEPADYYCSPRSACPGWVNQLTALSVLELITVDLAAGADLISPTPLLMVHGRKDDYTTPDWRSRSSSSPSSRAIRAGPRGRADPGAVDLYDVPQYVGPAVDEAVAWFYSYLRPR